MASANLDNAAEVTRIDSKAQAKIASNVEDYDALIHDAAQVTADEQAMTTWETIKAYPAAVFWVVIFGLGLVMEG